MRQHYMPQQKISQEEYDQHDCHLGKEDCCHACDAWFEQQAKISSQSAIKQFYSMMDRLFGVKNEHIDHIKCDKTKGQEACIL